MVHLNEINEGDEDNLVLDADVRKLIARANAITDKEKSVEVKRKKRSSEMVVYSKELTELQDMRGQVIARINILKKEIEQKKSDLQVVLPYIEKYPDIFELYTTTERTKHLEELMEKYEWDMVSKIQDLYHIISENVEECKKSIQEAEKRVAELEKRQKEVQHKGEFLVAKMNEVMDEMETDE